jgi:Phospholipase_D-nuclease N-terminal
MLRALLYLSVLALTIYAAVDCIQTPRSVIRYLPKGLWMVLILLVPVVASVGWLLGGRFGYTPARLAQSEWRRILGPDDDPVFLARLERSSNAEHEKLLEQWEADLRRREEELRRRSESGRGKDKDSGKKDSGKPAEGRNKPAKPSEGPASSTD